MDILYRSSNTSKSQTTGAPRASLGAGFEEEDGGEQLHREMVVSLVIIDRSSRFAPALPAFPIPIRILLCRIFRCALLLHVRGYVAAFPVGFMKRSINGDGEQFNGEMSVHLFCVALS